MEFDKSRVYTALNADELKIGSKIIFADNLLGLKQNVKRNNITILSEIRDESNLSRFKVEDGRTWNLAYLVEEPEEKKLKWTDLKVGDVITNGKRTAMIIMIDESCSDNAHIYAGNMWFTNNELTEWEKVED